jgi:hypothetical protein
VLSITTWVKLRLEPPARCLQFAAHSGVLARLRLCYFVCWSCHDTDRQIFLADINAVASLDYCRDHIGAFLLKPVGAFQRALHASRTRYTLGFRHHYAERPTRSSYSILPHDPLAHVFIAQVGRQAMRGLSAA